MVFKRFSIDMPAANSRSSYFVSGAFCSLRETRPH